MIEGLYSQGPASPQGTTDMSKAFAPLSRQNSGMLTKEENASMARDLHLARRPPHRSRTTHEHIPTGPQLVTVHHYPAPAPAWSPPQDNNTTAPYASSSQASSSTESLEEAVAALAVVKPAPLRRPRMGAPRRSYSVMDYEPVPPEQRPSTRLVLEKLPSELHYAIFDHLDPIDATCLGLTNSHFYDVHRRMHGTVPLSVRRSGPNELEWAWHLAGYPRNNKVQAAGSEADKAAGLVALRVRGKGLCRKCGVSRCELHKHIREWVPEKYEYCSVRDKFVPRPGEEAKTHCYMSNPSKQDRCGRHRPVKKENKEIAQ